MARNDSVTRRGFLAGAGLALGLAACASDAGEDADGDADASAKGSEEDELADAEDAGADAVEDADSDGADSDDEGSDKDADDEDAAEDDDADSDAGVASTDGLAATWNLRSSWVSGGSYFAKYEIDLQNGTGAAIAGWELIVTFNGAIGLSDGWNGSYSAAGSTLTIVNASYNGAIQAGDTAYDIGFIVSGDEGLAIESVSAQVS